MANQAKKAILRALVEGVLSDLMVKTTGEQVYLDAETTLSAKLAEMVTAINLRAKSEDVTAEIQAAVNGLVDGAPETYDTLKELADYVAAHQDVVDALNAAVAGKADKTAFEAVQATVNALGTLASKSTVSETDLDSALKEKVNAASEGNHSHANKALLDTYTQTEANLADAVKKKHSHANQTALNGITSDKVTAWDGKSTIYVAKSQPEKLAAGDLWISLE